KMSVMSVFAKTTLPAPIIAILGTARSSSVPGFRPPARRADAIVAHGPLATAAAAALPDVHPLAGTVARSLARLRSGPAFAMLGPPPCLLPDRVGVEGCPQRNFLLNRHVEREQLESTVDQIAHYLFELRPNIAIEGDLELARL